MTPNKLKSPFIKCRLLSSKSDNLKKLGPVNTPSVVSLLFKDHFQIFSSSFKRSQTAVRGDLNSMNWKGQFHLIGDINSGINISFNRWGMEEFIYNYLNKYEI